MTALDLHSLIPIQRLRLVDGPAPFDLCGRSTQVESEHWDVISRGEEEWEWTHLCPQAASFVDLCLGDVVMSEGHGSFLLLSNESKCRQELLSKIHGPLWYGSRERR